MSVKNVYPWVIFTRNARAVVKGLRDHPENLRCAVALEAH